MVRTARFRRNLRSKKVSYNLRACALSEKFIHWCACALRTACTDLRRVDICARVIACMTRARKEIYRYSKL